MRSTACLWSPVRHWKIALCSLSTGISLPPPCLTVRRKTSPAETRHSLLASAMSAPRRAAVRVGARPGVPAIAAITQPASVDAASSRPDLPAATAMPVPARADFSASYLPSSAVTASRAPNSRACSARSAMLPAPVKAVISNASRPPSWRTTSSVLAPIEPVEPNIVSLRGISLAFVIFSPSVVSGSHLSVHVVFPKTPCTFEQHSLASTRENQP